jgi:hypothetical protein
MKPAFALWLALLAPVSAARVEVAAPIEAAPSVAPVPTLSPALSPSLAAPSLAAAPLSAPTAALAAPTAALAAPVATLAAPAAAPEELPAAAPALAVAALPAADAPAAAASAASAPRAVGAAPAAAPSGVREQLAQLALGLGAVDAPAGADQSALSRFWDFMRDRHPAPTQQRLQARLEAARSFLSRSLRDPAIASRVATALRAQRAIAPEMDLPRATILARLERALDAGTVIRIASPSEARSLGSKTAAAAVTFPDGHVEIHVHPDSTLLTRAPPALLAATLLHELVHSEFGLGEYAAYVVETSYYLQLARLVPDLARDPDAAVNEEVRRDVFRGGLAGMIAENYGEKLLRHPDDVAALERDGARQRRRVAAALDDIAALETSGRWDLMPDKAEWLEQRLPREDDRRFYFQLVNAEVARLPDGAPFSAVFLRAAAAARAGVPAALAEEPRARDDGRASFPRIQAHLDSPRTPAAARGFGARAGSAVDGAAKTFGRNDTGVRLEALKTEGYAQLPEYALMGEASDRRILDEIDSRYIRNGQPWASILELSQPPSIHSNGETRWDDARHAPLNGLVKPFVERLTERLNLALPDENVRVRDVQIRIETKERAADTGIHVDFGGYLTATYALRGGGTDLYLTGPDGAVTAIRGPPHVAAVVTSKEREWATKILGTVHAAPRVGFGEQRVVVIIRYYRPGFTGEDMPAETSRRLDEVLRQRGARVRQTLDRQSRPPDDGGLLGFLRGVLR